MISVVILNIVNILAWCGLAVYFNKWWIALFACLTIMDYKSKHPKQEDDNEER